MLKRVGIFSVVALLLVFSGVPLRSMDSALHAAVKRGILEEVEDCVWKKNIDINYQNFDGDTRCKMGIFRNNGVSYSAGR